MFLSYNLSYSSMVYQFAALSHRTLFSLTKSCFLLRPFILLKRFKCTQQIIYVLQLLCPLYLLAFYTVALKLAILLINELKLPSDCMFVDNKKKKMYINNYLQLKEIFFSLLQNLSEEFRLHYPHPMPIAQK